MSSVTHELVVYRAQRGPSRDWSDLRRDRYLLRKDVIRPISLDKRVLPEPIAGEAPWVELIGTAIATSNSDVGAQRWPGSQVFEPLPSSQHWELLGYDICDETGMSSLMNCATGDSSLAQRWAPHLNRHHLFEQLDAADGFRADSDARIPEHGPFCIIGLYAPRSWGQLPT
jgi:hypothetical protein